MGLRPRPLKIPPFNVSHRAPERHPLFLDLDEESVFYIRIVLSKRNFQHGISFPACMSGNLRGNRFFPPDLTVESICDGAHIMKNIYTRAMYRVDRTLENNIFRDTIATIIFS